MKYPQPKIPPPPPPGHKTKRRNRISLFQQEKAPSCPEVEKEIVIENEVDPSWFESAVEQLKVSGGTAPFFIITLTDSGMKQIVDSNKGKNANNTLITKSSFIGKDLSHAQDEVNFYDRMKKIREREQEKDGVGRISYLMFDYLGVLNATTSTMKNNNNNYQLLVMKNLQNDYKKFRMIDLKIGKQTAQGGWKGKSRLHAYKQLILDGMTNSAEEGYRLEGFDGYPGSIASMDPLMDVISDDDTLIGSHVSLKDKHKDKARRIMLQNMKGLDIFMHLLDLHSGSSHSDEDNTERISKNIQATLTSIEVVEIVLHEIVTRLVEFGLNCHSVRVPQKWIGSSVALGYDAGLFPPRSTSTKDDDDTNNVTTGNDSGSVGISAEQHVRSKVITNIFDWGRSELLSKDDYETMSSENKVDRNKFWQHYKHGIDELANNAVRAYNNQYTTTMADNTNDNNVCCWKEIVIKIMDFDSLTSDDFLGEVTIPLPSNPHDDIISMKEIEFKEYQLSNSNEEKGKKYDKIISFVEKKIVHHNKTDSTVNEKKNHGSIMVSIAWVDLPASSRLYGMWRVKLIRAFNLPAMDVMPKSSDPYCLVIAKTGASSDLSGGEKQKELLQMTSIIKRNLNPVWNETIDIPVTKNETLTQQVLYKVNTEL